MHNKGYEDCAKYCQNDNVVSNNPSDKPFPTAIINQDLESTRGDQRSKWKSKVEFLLASIGTAVGLGNVWRFPYLVQQHGGGAFIIVYALCMCLLAIPIFYLELSLGQRFREGPLNLWYKFSKYYAGIGIGAIICSWYITIYYQMIVGWCFYYLFMSFSKKLPYASCPCVGGICNTTNPEYLPECLNATPTSYYWYRSTLNITDAIDDSGDFNWKLCFCLMLAWFIMCSILLRRLAIWGKVAYFTTLFPYVILIVFFIRGMTLEGAFDGVKHMFTPQFAKLRSTETWLAAFSQTFYTIGLGQGVSLAMSSYNDINNNIRNDALVIATANAFSSIFAGITTSGILGYKAMKDFSHCKEMQLKSIKNGVDISTCDKKKFLNQVAQGPGLVFIAYTEAISAMKCPQLWSVLFFLMILMLGIGTNVGQFEPVRTTISDLKFLRIRYEYRILLLCTVSFGVGLIFCQGSGEYWLQMFDTYCATYGLLVIALCEILVVVFMYGLDNFKKDITYMLGTPPSLFWTFCWKYIAPLLIVAIIATSIYQRLVSGISYTVYVAAKGYTVSQKYPNWTLACCIVLMLSSILSIPVAAIIVKVGCAPSSNDINDVHEEDFERGIERKETNM